VEWLERFAGTPNHPIGLLILFLSAGIEYVFPPFPGDSVTLFGAVLVGKWNWSFPVCFAAVAAGSTVGAAVDFFLGVKLHAWREGKDAKTDRAIEKILNGFRRWGIWLIAANRFFPGIRAFFFVAAGMAGFSFWPVIALAFLSAVVWNLLIFGVGVTIGSEFDRLKEFVSTYQTVAWILIGAAVLAGAVFFFLKRRSSAPPEPGPPEGGEEEERED